MSYLRWVRLLLAALALQLSSVAPLWAQGQLSFTRQDFRAGNSELSSVTVGDFNGDSQQDLATVSVFSGRVSILLGRGDGTFEPAQDFGAGVDPVSITVGDFTGDGRQDLATANVSIFGGRVFILLGRGDGTFEPAQEFAVGPNPSTREGITVGDFNGDSQQDLATASSGGSTVSVLLGNGDGTFEPAQHFGVRCCPKSIKAGDFNGDSQQDLATANAGLPDTVSILLGNGDGTFEPAQDVGVGVNLSPTSITVGDFNGDSRQDLATANVLDVLAGSVSILLGRGDGTFEPAQDFAVGGLTSSVTMGDFNNDGRQDLATANFNAQTVSILLGQGDGTFEPAQDFGTGVGPHVITVGDFNGDGQKDVATANVLNVSILINNKPLEITTYRLTRIGDVFFNPDLRDINEDGEMVGSNSFALERAILLRNGIVIELGDLAGGAAQSAVASGINDFTQITGSNKIQDASGNLVDRGFLWEGGQIRDLDLPGAIPRDINNRGEIVGTTVGADNVVRPFLYEAGQGGQTTLLKTLDPLPCPPGSVFRVGALKINNNSIVVGFSASPDGPRAVMWQNGEIMSLEPPIPLAAGQARDVNDQGDVIGVYSDSSGFVAKSFMWSRGRDVMELLPLERAGPDADALVSSINYRGQIVGDTRTMSLPQPNGTIATLWQDGEVLELNELISDDDPLKGQVNLFSAIEINGAGAIVARGLEAGLAFTYVMTPTGIPASSSVAPPPSASSPLIRDHNGGGAVDWVSLLLLVIVMSASATCVRRRQRAVLVARPFD